MHVALMIPAIVVRCRNKFLDNFTSTCITTNLWFHIIYKATMLLFLYVHVCIIKINFHNVLLLSDDKEGIIMSE